MPPGDKHLPCDICEKIPPGRPKHWKYAIEWTPELTAAYKFWLECNATGDFPEDDLVRWCAGEIREIHDEWARFHQLRIIARLGGKI